MITFSRLGKLGRMANGMFQIAGTIGIAVRSGQDYSFPLWQNHDHKDRFGSTEDIDLYKHFVNPLPLVQPGINFQEYPYYWGYSPITFPSGNWDLQSHFQSEKYFSHCIDLVRHYFEMSNEMDYSGRAAIHVRLGDYDENYHPRQKAAYYREAIKHIPTNIKPLLFSDDIKAAEKIMREAGVKTESVTVNYIDSFKIMKRCGHFITGNSSYSLMAAILAPNPYKVIVCPKNFFGPSWGVGQNEAMTKDIYPAGAVVI